MYKVLIVEDDPMVAMINEQYVLKHGKFKVVGKCQDGEKAIEFLAKNEADLVVMDVFMPKTDGFETLRRLRRDGKDDRGDNGYGCKRQSVYRRGVAARRAGLLG